jgi:hypothetical protein
MMGRMTLDSFTLLLVGLMALAVVILGTALVMEPQLREDLRRWRWRN